MIALVSLAGCSRTREQPIFKLLDPSETGITFENTITPDDSLNVQSDVYIYNGAGVAVGDIDNDGLLDVFFTGNMVSSRLYLNKGQMRFSDITDNAHVKTTRWATGATMADVNADGYMDVYVSASGPAWTKPQDRQNLLFINNHNRTFTEAAAQYGIADTSFTAHAVFFDYDKDGCLDLFLLNNSPRDFTRGVATNPTGARETTPGSYNELYRNDCSGGKPGHFTNVSDKAGILRIAGYGLGVVVSDLNGDGWPDIYISNDGTPNDVVYANNGDGTFTNKRAQWLKHTSAAGMGVDISDFNNDGRPDILQVDMLPRELSRRKRMIGFATYGSLMEFRSRGFLDDFTANSLQLNEGVTRDGNVVFSEIGHLAGISHTDWSWSALFADFDNDGNKDIFISNGYPKAINDLDYQSTMFSLLRRDPGGSRQQRLDLMKRLPSYYESNYVFRNGGDLVFTDKTKAWGIERPSFSYGAAYADLDNDGKLDLVINNIDAPAFIYHNIAPTDDGHHWLGVKLIGDSSREKTAGIGAQAIVTAGGKKQYIYSTPYRGYTSTVDDRLHFGLGRARRVDTLEVDWPDGRYQVLTSVDADRIVTVKQSDAKEKKRITVPASKKVFEPIDSRAGLAYKHRLPTAADYSIQALLPYMISRHGPPLAVADVNRDHLDDVFVGGGAGFPAELFVQNKNGTFSQSAVANQPWIEDKAYEDWGALFFDANGDGLSDLYVASGSYQLAPSSPLLQDRLYINRAGGRFERDDHALPPILTSTSVVRAGDFNGDGRPDLFVGGRLSPRNYPAPARSYILRNDGGHFTDVTDQLAPDLNHPGGMITDALWIDFDGDGRVDLVTAGEWMPIQFYRNDGNRVRNVTQSTGLPPTNGWWYSLAAGDFDHDGRIDIVAGNLGLNYTYTTSKDSTFGVYAADLTGNHTRDIILAKKLNGTDYPFAGLASLGQAVYTVGMRFPTYGSFSETTIPQLMNPLQLKTAIHYQAYEFASLYLHNLGGGKFGASQLPNRAQVAPIKGIVTTDVDGDGNLDLIIAGNLYDAEPNTPRADAGNGLWLRGNGRGHFAPQPPSESGLLAPRDVAGLALINTAAGKVLLVANTGDSLQVFKVNRR